MCRKGDADSTCCEGKGRKSRRASSDKHRTSVGKTAYWWQRDSKLVSGQMIGKLGQAGHSRQDEVKLTVEFGRGRAKNLSRCCNQIGLCVGMAV